jgi:glycosyltransferase involved in cell wall biosynthesis
VKIIYISAGIIPSERANTIQVMKVCQAFTQMGHTVTLLVPASPEPVPAWEALADHYGLKTQFDIRTIPLTAFMKRRDFPWRAARVASQMGADLVYARAVSPAVLGLLVHLPTMLEMHQLPSGTFGSTWFRLFLRLKGRKRLVPITHALERALHQRYDLPLNKEQIVVAASGVDLDRFADLPDPVSARGLLHLPEGWTVVCTGHLYAGRGLDLVMNLASRLPNVNFMWVGGSSKEVEVGRSQAIKAGLKNLNLIGFVLNSKLPLYQAAANALLIPYTPGFTNSGGEDISAVSSPMKIFEYMASRRIIISSDLPVLREVLNEKNAIFCPPEDVDAWELTVRHLQLDPQTAQPLVDQARLDAEKYSWLERSRLILAGFVEDKI